MYLFSSVVADSGNWWSSLGLDALIWGVTALNWFIVIGVGLATTLLFLVAGAVIRRLVRKADETSGWVDTFVRHLFRRTRPFVVLLVALYVASLAIVATDEWEETYTRIRQFLQIGAIIAFLIQTAIWGNASINFFAQRARETQQDGAKRTSIMALSVAGKTVLWTLIALLTLSNLGVNISALIAGLGIGGVAIALASQKILGDLFASVVMMFDRPFDIGDFIIVGDKMGVVDTIGLKTTKLRALSGEQLIFSNSDLLDSRIHNFKRMQQRRIAFEFGVTYDTPVESMAKLPGWVQEIIESTPNTRFDRAHFTRYGDYAKIIAVVYFVTAPDFMTYMNAQQEINLAIGRKLEAENIDFAFPSQTLYVHRMGDADV